MIKDKGKKISVIMGVYNGMPYLKESVKSILNQTYKNLEFIIVNDASTDSSEAFLKSIEDPRVILLSNKKNLGLAPSLNIALKKSNGDFIARMDADDISEPSRFEKQIDLLEKSKQISLCGTWAVKIDKVGKKIGSLHYPTSPEEIRKSIFFFNPIIHPSLMAKRLFFDKLKGYNEKFDNAEDYELLSRGINTFKYANLPEELLRLRLSAKRRSIESMRQMERLDLMVKLNLLKTSGPTILKMATILKKLAFIYIVPSPVKIRLAQVFKRA